MSEFPDELADRCAKKAFDDAKGGPFGGWIANWDIDPIARQDVKDRWRDIARSVLRESGHAELVAALQRLVANSGYMNLSDTDLRTEADLGNFFAPILLEARAALRKAGAL